jgi:hypothetical protein
MTQTIKQPWKWHIVHLVGISLVGVGLCFAVAFGGLNYSEERLAKEKQQVAAKMDEMKSALAAAKVPPEQVPGLLRVHKAALVRGTTNEHFIILSFSILLSLLVSSVGLIVALWAKLRVLLPPNPQGGANGGQPVHSETNGTSAAAASRRSP